jgi:hypothetical protein
MGSRYWRVMTLKEGAIVRQHEIVPANRDAWEHAEIGCRYGPDEVVFLFTDAVPRGRDHARSFARTRLTELGAVEVLQIDAELPVREDVSAVPGFGSVVHIGPINLKTACKSIRQATTAAEVDEIFAATG